MNLYRSVGNNPLTSLDPSGLDDDIPLPNAVAVPLTKPRLPILLTLPPHLALRGLQQNESSSGYLAPWNPNARYTLEGSLIGDILDGALEPIRIGGDLIRAGMQTVSLGTHALGVTDIYEYEPHSWLFQGWFQSCDEGRADEYLWQVELGVVTLGIKPLVEAIDAGDWRNVARMSGGYLAGGAFLKGGQLPRSRPATIPERGTIPEFGPNTLGAAQASHYIPGYGWTDRTYWRLVRRLQAGESVEAPSLRVAAELRRDAFPEWVRSRYRGPLSQAPNLRGTYDWHNPQKMIHPGPHQDPHIQITLQDGTIVRILVKKVKRGVGR